MFFKWLQKIVFENYNQAGPGTPAYEEIKKLPLSIARQEAFHQIRNPAQFDIVAPVPEMLPPDIPSEIYDFFLIGSRIQSTHSELLFDDQCLKESHAKPYLKIGTDIEHTEVWIELTSGEAICADNEAVDVGIIDGPEWLTDERYPSIWHYILIHCAQVYGYRFQPPPETTPKMHS